MAGQAARPAADVPLPLLIGIAVLIVAAIGGAALGRYQRTHAVAQATQAGITARRLLAFTDMPSGEVAVTDATDGRPLVLLPRGADNFIRATIRDLVHQRPDRVPAPFELTAWRGGRLTLRDTADDRTLELEAFGPTNAADFARLLTVDPAP